MFSEYLNLLRMRSATQRSALKKLRKLHGEVTRLFAASPLAQLDQNQFVAKLALEVCELCEKQPSSAMLHPFFDASLDLMFTEGLWEPPEIDWRAHFTLEDEVELRRYLQGQARLFSRYDELIDIWREKLLSIFSGVLGYLPDSISADDSADDDEAIGFQVTLIDLLDNPAEVIQRLLVTIRDTDASLFATTRQRMERNILIASGVDPKGTYGTNRTVVVPTEAKNTSPQELVEQYLGGTPFEDLLLYPYPFVIPREARFEHCHIVGGTGHGKTQLIQSLIYDDLFGSKETRPGICVIDSQGDLIKNLSRLECFDPTVPDSLADKLIIIDPTDIDFPVCLNLFDFHLDRVGSLPALQRETVLNGTVDLFEYMFGALLGAELTQRQGLIFKYLARLLMTIPGANIHTMRELMEDGKRFKPYMDRLEGSTRSFFETQFFSPSFNATKKQILTRLWGVLSNSTLERMFSHEKNKVDLFEAMNSGKIVLINTAKDLLKRDGCQILGRFFIALLGQAVLERAALPSEQRRPFFAYIDEAQEYFDERVEELLNQARKYRVGLTLAHQTLDQLSPRLKAVFMANTSIKYVGGASAKDASDFAREMHCTPDQITSTRKRATYTEFACFVRNVTHQTIRIKTPLGLIEQQPVLDEEQFAILKSNNRDIYAAPAYTPKEVHVTKIPEVEPERQAPLPPPAPQPHREETRQTSKTTSQNNVEVKPARSSEPPVQPLPKVPKAGRGGTQHTYLQGLVKRLAEEHGYRATIEEQILGGKGSVDVSLVRGDKKIAVEISVTTTPQHELGNIQKCLATGYDTIFVLTSDKSHSRKLQQYTQQHLEEELQERVFFYLPDQFIEFLDQDDADQSSTSGIVRGYKVKVQYNSLGEEERKGRREAIAKVIANSMRRMKSET